MLHRAEFSSSFSTEEGVLSLSPIVCASALGLIALSKQTLRVQSNYKLGLHTWKLADAPSTVVPTHMRLNRNALQLLPSEVTALEWLVDNLQTQIDRQFRPSVCWDFLRLFCREIFFAEFFCQPSNVITLKAVKWNYISWRWLKSDVDGKKYTVSACRRNAPVHAAQRGTEFYWTSMT